MPSVTTLMRPILLLPVTLVLLGFYWYAVPTAPARELVLQAGSVLAVIAGMGLVAWSLAPGPWRQLSR